MACVWRPMWRAAESRGSVVLAHGGGQTRHSWASTATRLAESGWKTIALDLRGHGESQWAADGDYQIQRFAEDLVAVSAGLPDKPALIGASLGGMAGMMVETVVAPGTFRSLTLVDIIPNSDPAGVAKIMGFMAANLDHGFENLEAAADSIAAYLPRRTRPSDLTGLRKNLRLGQDGRYRWHWDPRFVTGMGASGRSENTAFDFEARCRDVDIDDPSDPGPAQRAGLAGSRHRLCWRGRGTGPSPTSPKRVTWSPAIAMTSTLRRWSRFSTKPETKARKDADERA